MNKLALFLLVLAAIYALGCWREATQWAACRSAHSVAYCNQIL